MPKVQAPYWVFRVFWPTSRKYRKDWLTMETKKLSDGSVSVATGRNIHNNHIHLAADETILSHKEGGVTSDKYTNTCKDLSSLYEKVAGERNKLPVGWKQR